MIEQEKNDEEVKSEIRQVYIKSDFDSPDAIDWDLLNKGVKLLKEGKPFNIPIYDQDFMTREERTIHIHPERVLIVEGHLIFCNEELMK